MKRENHQAKDPLSGERILLVDDEESVRTTLESILREEGYHVSPAASGEEAIQIMTQTPFDLVLTDMKMEGVSGLDVLERAQKLWPRPVTILLTGYASLESAVEALRLGAYGYLTKPCGIEELKLSIRQGLEKKRLSEVEILYQISRTLISNFHLDGILKEILREASRVTGFSRGLFLLYKGKEIRVASTERKKTASEADWAPVAASVFKEEKEILERLRKGEVILISSPEEAKFEERRVLRRLNAKAFFAIPLLYQGRFCGVFYLDQPQTSRHFTKGDIRLVLGLADMAAVAIQNADLFETLRRTNRGLLRTKWALETANSQLKSLDQMKTNLLSNVSHELKTPMVAVKGYAGLILKGKAGPVTPLQKEYLEISLRNIQRQLALIDDLLNFSKLETGGDFFLMERIDLIETLNESLHLIRPRAEEKKIGLEVHAAPGPHWVRADRVKIGQVFNNLLSNAVKFTPERGKVTVAFKKGKNGSLNVSVSDTGIGIHPKKREKIFERFYQVESSESRRYGGIGLGLAITQDIVKRHGGQIKVAGRWGRGARFTFSLPMESLSEASLPGETKGGERMERTGSMD